MVCEMFVVNVWTCLDVCCCRVCVLDLFFALDFKHFDGVLFAYHLGGRDFMRSVGLPDVQLSLGSTDLHIICRLQSGNFLLGGEGAVFDLPRGRRRISAQSSDSRDFLALRLIPSIRVWLTLALSCVVGAATCCRATLSTQLSFRNSCVNYE